MYLHLGKGTVVNTADIIAIMDLESSSHSPSTREFLKEEGFVRNVSEELPKTYIICEIDGQSVVYVTNISSKALAGRAEKYR